MEALSQTVNPAALHINRPVVDDNPRAVKRPRTDYLTQQSPFYSPPFNAPPLRPGPAHARPSSQVIDLTDSPPNTPAPRANPQPATATPGLPTDLSPRTPICIGQLTVTALVLYPVHYLQAVDPRHPHAEWAPVKLAYEHTPSKPDGADTVHIKVPTARSSTGEVIPGEAFGVVEQKVATSLGPMLGKGLIRLDANVRRGAPNAPILPLQMLVFTPKGNIPIVGNYLHQCGLLLDHPTPPFDLQRLSATYHYVNPHNPPPGGFNKAFLPSRATSTGMKYSQWSSTSVSSKSTEVQRSQVDELFKTLKSGDDLRETEPGQNIGTKLYPHQKKALTFLLEREREISNSEGSYSSLWQRRRNDLTRQLSWYHLVTQKEVFEEPQEGKGSILADDMGLGKTITCVSLIASTMHAANQFGASPIDPLPPQPESDFEMDAPAPMHFAGSVYGMPDPSSSSRAKGKANRTHEKLQAEWVRKSQIKAKSRASLIVCPLSTISNWEDQFREHWNGPVTVIGGAGGTLPPSAPSVSSQLISMEDDSSDTKPVPNAQPRRDGDSLMVYIYHGNARRPDPRYLANFDVVITTFSTLASEFSRQNKSVQPEEEEEDSSDGIIAIDGELPGTHTFKLSKPKKNLKRKKTTNGTSTPAVCSALQAVHWFRVVLDEAHCIKETSTVGSRASCELVADRRLCLTGTPVQNKLDDIFALIKFLRLAPLDDKTTWTEFVGAPVKFNQPLGIVRLQSIMSCITLRRTKESKAEDGTKILDLPPRTDELRTLQFDPHEQSIYDQFFKESKEEFAEMADRNEVMKNYVGILQRILRLRQICDHFELVEGKGPQQTFANIAADIQREGINVDRAQAIFNLFRESASTQCQECGIELAVSDPAGTVDDCPPDGTSTPAKRGRKTGKGVATSSRGPTRANSPANARIVLTRCQHLFCFDCYRNCICPGWPSVPPDTARTCSACQGVVFPSDAVEIKDLGAEIQTRQKPVKREKRKVSIENLYPSTKIKSLMQDLVESSRKNMYSCNYDPESIEVQMVDRNGNDIDDGVCKTVVFSQWTSMLDKIEDALDTTGIRYERLDGTMKRDERTKAMDALKHDPACEVLLVSLKAGGVGLNLTAAQRVYLMDPYWNPAVENQAVDRIHRLGQRKPVRTIKLIIGNSIEAKLLAVQKKKMELANMTFGKTYSKSEMQQRRMDELNQFFGDS